MIVYENNKKMNYYKQCTLIKGSTSDIAWIPEELARLGGYVKIKGEDGWKVITVGTIRQPEDYLLRHSFFYCDF